MKESFLTRYMGVELITVKFIKLKLKIYGRYTLKTEVATLNKLITVRNPKPEILQVKYQHLQGIEFCKEAWLT